MNAFKTQYHMCWLSDDNLFHPFIQILPLLSGWLLKALMNRLLTLEILTIMGRNRQNSWFF
jgi:hypothetical protein